MRLPSAARSRNVFGQHRARSDAISRGPAGDSFPLIRGARRAPAVMWWATLNRRLRPESCQRNDRRIRRAATEGQGDGVIPVREDSFRVAANAITDSQVVLAFDDPCPR